MSAITLNCGGATISLTQGDQPISLTCGAATLTLPARGKAAGPSKASTPVAPAAPAGVTHVAASEPRPLDPIPTRARYMADTPIITLAAADPPASGGGAGGAGDGGRSATTPPKPKDDKATGSDKGNTKPSDFYVGAGFAISQNVGSRRASDVKLISRSDGRVFAQVQKSEDQSISAMFETHYLLANQGIFGNEDAWYKTPDTLAKLFACGPFALVSNPAANRAGCGPLFTAIIDSDGKVSQFGIGWALGLGKASDKDNRASFGVGLGLLFNPDAKVVDYRIVEPGTMLVRPEFKDTAVANTTPVLVDRQTTSAFVMVSKTF